LEEVQSVLDALSVRPVGSLVVKLPRQMGQKEQRYAHRLSGTPAPTEAPAPPPRAETPTALAEPENDRVPRLESEFAALRSEVEQLKRDFAAFRQQFE
jgi:hypothetical protein